MYLTLSFRTLQDGFGDFQEVAPYSNVGASDSQPNILAASLVNLGGLSLNNANKGTTNAGPGPDDHKSKFKQHDSFRGLDGFNTTPMPMGGPLGVRMGAMMPSSTMVNSPGMQQAATPQNSFMGHNPQQQQYGMMMQVIQQQGMNYPGVMGQPSYQQQQQQQQQQQFQVSSLVAPF